MGSEILSRIATNDQHGEDSPYFDGWKAYDKDPFHPTQNPHGVIQMGLAENQLCSDLIKDWIKKNPQASICTPEGIDNFSGISNFQDYHGLKEFREGVAKFMGKTRGDRVKFDPDRIVMSGGATGANETIMFCLADPGDAFLLPTPYYAAFDRDLRWRTGVQIIPVHCSSTDNFKLTKEALESAYQKAQDSNIKVKGLILTNPSNPLGTTLDRSTLQSLVRFVNSKRIHLVCDEIYAATIFAGPSFVSLADVLEEMGNSEIDLDLFHIVYSMSKDLGLPGFRVGIIYSYNDSVISCARKMSSFGLVSSQTQFMLASMLFDDIFVDNLIVESAKRLGQRHKSITLGLEKVGITCLRSNAGLYVWMDLRHLLRDSGFESEMELWRVIVNQVKLNVSPGSSFHCKEPGWFRVCFANMDDHTVEIAVRRIQDFVSNGKKKARILEIDIHQTQKKNRCWQKDLRLSFSSRIYDEHVLSSPRMMSPGSPLVQART